MARFAPSLAALALVSTTSALASAASYDQPGPLAVKTVSVTAAGNATQIAYPDGPGPYPLLILGHGFSSSPDNQIGWGQHFASYGFIAVAPTLCTGFFCAPDPTAVPGIVSAAIAYMEGPDAPAGVQGKVDAAHIGLEGHSAGGQALAVTAAMTSPQAVVLFDPVGGTGMTSTDAKPGSDAVPQICSPLLTIFAESQAGANSCNKNGNWKPFGMSSMGPRGVATVQGATHCDGENVAMGTCGLVCGGNAAANRQGRFAYYATAWFLAYLKGDQDALAAVTLPQMQADPLLHDADRADGPSCGGGTGGAGGAGGGTSTGAGGDATGTGGASTGAGGDATGAGGDPVGAGGQTTGTGGASTGTGGQATGAGGQTTGAGGQATTGTGGSSSGGTTGAAGHAGGGVAGAGGGISAGTGGVAAGTGGAGTGPGGSGAAGKTSGGVGGGASAGTTGGTAADDGTSGDESGSSGGCGVSREGGGGALSLLAVSLLAASLRRRRSA